MELREQLRSRQDALEKYNKSGNCPWYGGWNHFILMVFTVRTQMITAEQQNRREQSKLVAELELKSTGASFGTLAPPSWKRMK